MSSATPTTRSFRQCRRSTRLDRGSSSCVEAPMSSRSPRDIRFRWVKQAFATLLLLASATTAGACPLCYGAAKQLITIGVQLDMAERAVLAAPLADGRYRVVEVIKGNAHIGDLTTDKVTGT